MKNLVPIFKNLLIRIQENHNEFITEIKHVSKLNVFKLHGRSYITIEEYEAIHEAILNYNKGCREILKEIEKEMKKNK